MPRRSAATVAAQLAVGSSLREYARGAVGGLLFSLPILYTMEMWWAGFLCTPTRLLSGLCATFVMLALVLHYSDFTSAVPARETGYFAAARSTTQSYAVALLVSAASLWFYGRFTDEAGTVICAQVVVLGFASMLGASAGRLLLQPS